MSKSNPMHRVQADFEALRAKAVAELNIDPEVFDQLIAVRLGLGECLWTDLTPVEQDGVYEEIGIRSKA